MVVSEKTGRKRYIAFDIIRGAELLTRSKLARVLKANRDGSPDIFELEVLMIEGGRGILRTDHKSAPAVIELLRTFDFEREGFELRPLKTSGTVKKLKKKYFSGPTRLSEGQNKA